MNKPVPYIDNGLMLLLQPVVLGRNTAERVFAQGKECIARALGALANQTWKHESAKAGI